MFRRFAALASLVTVALSACAPAQTYGQRKIDIHAGVLVIESAQSATTRQPMNFTPFVWYQLDSAFSVKPAGWNIVNPRPTTQVSDAVFARWSGLGTDLGFTPPAVGSGLGKGSAPYWEVRLNTVSDQQLSEYDILLLSAYGYTALNTAEREKLRKFVDQGGVLWVDVDDSTNFNDARVNTFPLPFDKVTNGSVAQILVDQFHPLLSNPYSIASSINQLRLNPLTQLVPINAPALREIESWIESDYAKWTVVGNGVSGGQIILDGKMGVGHMVVTSGAFAAALNRVPITSSTYSANNKFSALSPALDRAGQTAAKLAINMINLGSTYSEPGGGPRKSNSISIDLQPPLLKRFDATETGVLANQSPIIYKGITYVAAGDRLYAYDSNPRLDLDNDGNTDDGIVDFSEGQKYDLLWVSQSLGGAISAPAAANIAGAAVEDQIFVVGETGALYAFDALQLAGGVIQPNQNTAPLYTVNPPSASSFDTSLPGPGPYAPTIHDGMVYIADVATSGSTTGRIWVADPVSQAAMTSGATPWQLGANGVQALPEPSGSPTIGYIPIQDNSGGYDRVLYYPGRPQSFSGQTATLTSLWLGVRGESPPPNSIFANPGDLTIVTRAARQGISVYLPNGAPVSARNQRASGVKLTILHPNGDPFTDAEMAAYFDGSVSQSTGTLTFPLRQPLPAGIGVRLDYSLDMGLTNGAQTIPFIRGQLSFPDDPGITNANSKRRIIGNIAMSPRGTLYCIVSTGQDGSDVAAGGSFYAVREDIGRGGFRMLTRYDLYRPHQMTLNQATSYQQPATVTDNDPLTGLEPTGFLRGPFSRLTFVGTPSVRNGVVYVTAMGRKTSQGGFQGFIPFGVLFAFKAEPEPAEIRVGDIGNTFTLRQADVTRSSNKQTPNQFNELTQGQFSYDKGEGIIRLDSLMATTKGPVINAFSTSQPIIIRRPNQPDVVIEPDSTGAKWSPLLWYTVLHGVQPTGGAMTTGESVFVPGASVIPNLDLLRTTGTIRISGLIYAWNGAISPADPFLQGDATRPWVKQLYQLKFTGNPAAPIDANPDLLWPQFRGMRDMQDWFVRVRQTTTGQSTICYGVAAGEGVLAAWGDRGVYSFTRADFLVADENRLVRFDSAGNPLWASNISTTTGTSDEGSVSALKPLVRPTRAYPLGENEIIAVDPGANRVARLDLAGRELRSITGFTVDPNNIPDGYKAGDPTTLDDPRDVAVFTTRGPGATEIWVHYVIADAGNRRIVDVVDKLNSAATITRGVLNWHSPSNYTGKNFQYSSLSRIYVPGASPGTGKNFIAAGIGSATPSRINTGLDSPDATQVRESATGNGGIVIFDPTDPSNNIVINQVAVPGIPQNVFWDFNTGAFNSPPRAGRNKTLTNLTSVTMRVVQVPNVATSNKARVAIMFTDATGVYEIYQEDPSIVGSPWVVRWMLPNEIYRAVRRIGNSAPSGASATNLRASYARRLDSGDVLVVNGYAGKTLNGNDFMGEILQFEGGIISEGDPVGYDPAQPNMGFDLRSILFELPPVQGARGLVLPVFADRR